KYRATLAKLAQDESDATRKQALLDLDSDLNEVGRALTRAVKSLGKTDWQEQPLPHPVTTEVEVPSIDPEPEPPPVPTFVPRGGVRVLPPLPVRGPVVLRHTPLG